MSNAQNRPHDEDCRRLARLLDDEVSNYRRLLRLAWRQNSYMKRQDVDRLEANAREWARHLPTANEARIARERHVGRLMEDMGVSIDTGRIDHLLDYTPGALKNQIKNTLGELRQTAGKLARQNELNRHLAEFCLDLSHEETEIFKRCVLEDPAGCYDEGAVPAGRGPGGVLVRQA